MAPKEIATVGFEIPGYYKNFLPIRSKSSLLDYDITIIDPDISNCYQPNQTYKGRYCLSENESFHLKECLQHWRKEIEEVVKIGKSVFILLRELHEVFVDTGEREYSGTGQDRAFSRVVNRENNLSLIPGKFSFRGSSGNKMNLSGGNNILSPLWADIGEEFKYHILIEGEVNNPLLFPGNSKTPVAAHVRFKDYLGDLYLLPHIDFSQKINICDEGGMGQWTEEAIKLGKCLISGIITIDDMRNSSSKHTTPPEWVNTGNKYILREESRIRDALEKNRAETKNLESEEIKLKKSLDKEATLKRLLYEQGAVLESAVILALEKMEFKAENYREEDLEFDVVAESKEGRFLGEVEGKNNTAIKIDKLRQLETNIFEDSERAEVDEPAKGVLFGNAYRFSQPSERKEFFTTRCVSFAKKRKRALIRTPDLFKVAKYLSENVDRTFAQQCRQTILNGVGIVEFPSIPKKAKKRK